MRNIDLMQGASTLCMLKLNNSLAMEPKSTLDATRISSKFGHNALIFFKFGVMTMFQIAIWTAWVLS
jgi:hypothetical protein